MPTKDIPSYNHWVDGFTPHGADFNEDFDQTETQLQGIEDRLEESLTALHIDGVIWKRPGDVVDLLVSAGAGLSVNVSAGEALVGYRLEVTAKTNDGGTGGTIADASTNYCYLMQDMTLFFNVTGVAPTTQRNILLATVTTAGGVVTAVNNYAVGVVRGVGQPSLRSFTCTATEAVRDAVYISAANTVSQAESDDANPAKARVVGIILAKESATSCVVGVDGAIVGGYTGLSSGSAYYLQTVAGTLGTGKPTAPDPIVPVGIAVSTTAMLVKVFVDEAALGGPGDSLPDLTDVDDALAYTAGHVLRADGAQYTDAALAHADLADDNELVHTSGNETIAGLKTFSTLPQSSVVPATGDDLVNKTYADAFAQGLTPKEACRVASTANLTLSGEQTIDGIAAVSGDRVLAKDQTTGTENGIYVCAAGAWSRATDYDASAEVQEGTFCYVAEGTANGGKEFVQITVDPVLDTDPLVFVWLSNPNLYSGSNGVKLVAQDFQIDLSDTNPSLEVADGGVRAKVDALTIDRSASGLEVIGVSGDLLSDLPSVAAGANKLPTANLGSGVADATTFLRGDQAWATPVGVGAGVIALNYTKAMETDVTQTTIVNDATEQTLYSYTVPGGTLGMDKILRLMIAGRYLHNSGGNKTLRVKMKYGGSEVTAKTSGAITTNAAYGNFHFELILAAKGLTDAQQGYMLCSCESGANISVNWDDRGFVAVDSTVDQALLITVQHSAADPNLSISTRIQHIELLNAEDTIGAPTDAAYVTLLSNGNLTAERILTGTENQIIITDNGPGAAVVVSTPQDIHTEAAPIFAGLTVAALEGVLLGTAGVVSAEAEANFERTANKDAASGYAGLDGASKVDTSELTLPYIRNEIIVVVAGELTADAAVPKVGYMKAPAALTIEEIVCEVDTAPTGAALIVDIHKIPVADIETDFTGTTIYTTQGNRPTLAISDRHVVATLPDVTAIAQGDVLRVYVDQVGSTVAGSDLTVAIRVKQQAAWS